MRLRKDQITEIERVVNGLASATHASDGSFIQTPLLYVSGSHVVVRVDAGDLDGSWFVSDYGMGAMEADMLGAIIGYKRFARIVAENAGVKFDENAFFVAQVTTSQLAGAVTTIANCSQEAVAVTALRQAERKSTEDQAILYDRLVRIFTPIAVIHETEMVGSSTTTWPFSNVVQIDGRPRAIFETVSLHKNSVASVATKFHDISLLELPPRRVAVVRNRDAFGSLLNVLTQSADVIQFNVSDSTIRNLAA